MYHFPSSKRDIHSHIHTVPAMREDVAKSQVLNQRSNSPCFKDSVIRNVDMKVSSVVFIYFLKQINKQTNNLFFNYI